MTAVVVTPNDPLYEKVAEAFSDRKKRVSIDYDGFCAKYNAAEVGSVILLPVPAKRKAIHVASVLVSRGLEHEVDFSAVKLTTGADGTPIPVGDRPVAIKKLTDKTATTR